MGGLFLVSRLKKRSLFLVSIFFKQKKQLVFGFPSKNTKGILSAGKPRLSFCRFVGLDSEVRDLPAQATRTGRAAGRGRAREELGVFRFGGKRIFHRW